ncbi:unnamed protein product [Allacma fusca]|uniref:Protein SSUH2 homolog n=1 Tax=Allacma fusca TaxID=39272 RepID=A0A8J2JGZ0_9HEXA|nr:unnamed protein product [Allacma fusca]
MFGSSWKNFIGTHNACSPDLECKFFLHGDRMDADDVFVALETRNLLDGVSGRKEDDDKREDRICGNITIDYSPSAPYPSGTLQRPHGTKPPPEADSGFYRGDDGDIIPSAPPLEVLDAVAGYETLSFDSVNCPPPSPTYGNFEWLDPAQPILNSWGPGPENSLRYTIPQMSESMAKTALLAHVKNHCCWGVGAAKNMCITSFRHTTAFHYVLHTFTEKREARWAWSPHVGGDVDGPEQGNAPSPWEISAVPSKPFHNEVSNIEVPHTASVKPCHRCKGAGTLGCPHCHGKGWTRCIACHGEGFGLGSESRERCIVCGTSSHGHGRQDCTRCGAKGRISCSICDSYGQLKCFIQLTVSWKVTVGEHVTGGDDLPPDLVRQVDGQIGLEETGVRLTPLPPDIIPDETLAMASAQLITDHLETSADLLLLAQRHQVRIVPITVIDYQWKRHAGRYYVYGIDKRVFAPDYPQTCCCGCSIL